jgi:hypothetical protein
MDSDLFTVVLNEVYYFGFVANLTISQQENSFSGWNLEIKEQLQWFKDVSPTKVGLKSADSHKNFCLGLVIVFPNNIFLDYLRGLAISALKLCIRSKPNNSKLASNRETFDKKRKSLFCQVHARATHWSTSVDHEDKAKVFAFTQFNFFRRICTNNGFLSLIWRESGYETSKTSYFLSQLIHLVL